MLHKCSLCGSIAFKTYHEYQVHQAVNHGLKTQIRPERITNRTVAEIVKDSESTWLKPHIVDGTVKRIVLTTNNDDEHLKACTCFDCINKRLDVIIADSQITLDNLRNSGTLEHD